MLAKEGPSHLAALKIESKCIGQTQKMAIEERLDM